MVLNFNYPHLVSVYWFSHICVLIVNNLLSAYTQYNLFSVRCLSYIRPRNCFDSCFSLSCLDGYHSPRNLNNFLFRWCTGFISAPSLWFIAYVSRPAPAPIEHPLKRLSTHWGKAIKKKQEWINKIASLRLYSPYSMSRLYGSVSRHHGQRSLCVCVCVCVCACKGAVRSIQRPYHPV